jgi:hypothetical protein
MRNLVLIVAAFSVLSYSCGSGPKPSVAETAKRVDAPKPSDESRRFPAANLVKAEVFEKELMGKPFMPGGNLAFYKAGKTEYEMFAAKLSTATDAAILLSDWQKGLTDSKFVPSFGGYFGRDAGRPTFVFAKGAWIAGIAGLPEPEADLQARVLAAHLD